MRPFAMSLIVVLAGAVWPARAEDAPPAHRVEFPDPTPGAAAEWKQPEPPPAVKPAAPAPKARASAGAARNASAPVRAPYRITDTNHILVRAKINGRGPYNFVVDSGAPSLFLMPDAARDAGLLPAEAPDGKSGPKAESPEHLYERVRERMDGPTVATLEFEGGAVLKDVKAEVDDTPQLASMNALGLPGVPLHGVLGYTALAPFRIEIDAAQRHMTWTRLDFSPPPLPTFGEWVEMLGDTPIRDLQQKDRFTELLVHVLAALQDEQARVPRPQGCLGIELEAVPKGARVTAVHRDGPAAAAGVRAGDVIEALNDKPVPDLDALIERAHRVAPGDAVVLRVRRESGTTDLRMKASGGL